MNTGFSTARRHALIAVSATVVLLAGAACTSTERSTGTGPAPAANTAGESFVGSTQASPSTGNSGTVETAATDAPASRTSPAISGTADSTTPTAKSSKATGASDAATTADPTAPAFPDQPAVVAAARASIDQVVQLHALAVSAGHPGRIPGEVIPSTASTIADTLGQQVTMILALAPAADSAQAQVADALDGYQDLAGQLAKWDPASEKPLSAKFFAALAKNDRAYLAALKKLGAVTGENVVEGMPELLMPTT